MSYNAGDIESRLTADRSPFTRELKAAKAEAAEFVKNPIKAKIDLDLAHADQQLREFRARMDLAARTRRASIIIDTRQSETNLGRLNQGVKDVSNQTRKTAQQAEQDFHLMFNAISILGPALLPLGAGLAGISAGAIGVGLDLGLAFKGAKTEAEDATRVGLQYKDAVEQMGAGVKQLERTAADGVVTPFTDEVDKLLTRMPQLNQFIKDTSHTAGDVAAKGADTLFNLFSKAEPLIVTAEQQIDRLLTRVDNWSAGPGATQFFDALAKDIPIAVSAIGNLGSLLGHLVTGFGPVGHTILEIVNDGTHLLALLTQWGPVTQTAAYAFVAWRVASLASAAANKLFGVSAAAATTAAERETVALNAQAVAAARAAEAMNALGIANLRTGSIAGWSAVRGAGAVPVSELGGAAGGAAVGAGAVGLSGRLGALIPKALAAGITAYFGSSAAANATSGWKGRDNWQSALAAGSQIGKDIFTFHWGNIGSDFGMFNGADQRTRNQRAYQSLLNRQVAGYPGYGALVNQYQTTGSLGQQANIHNTKLSATLSNFGALSNPDAVTNASDRITTSLQKQITAQEKLFDTSKGGITLYNGLKVSYDAWDHALASTDPVRATAMFENQAEALDRNKEALAQVQEITKNYGNYLTNVTGKYKITTEQAVAFSKALGLNAVAIGANNKTEQDAVRLTGLVADKFKNGNAAMQGWLATIAQVDPETATLSDKVALLGAGLQALRGTTLDMAGSNLTAVGSLEAASNAIAQNSKSVGANGQLLGQLVKHGKDWVVEQPKLTAGSLQIQQAMSGAAAQAIGLAQAIYQNTGNAHQAYSAYEGLRAQFVSTMVQAGYTKKAAETMATELFGAQGSAEHFVTKLQRGSLPAAIADLTKSIGHFGHMIETVLIKLAKDNPSWDSLGATLRSIETTPIVIPVKAGSGPHVGGLLGDQSGTGAGGGHDPSKLGRSATGRYITSGSGPTADDVPVWVSRGEYIVNAAATARHFDLIDGINNNRFASGGQPLPPSLITDGGGGSSKKKSGSGGSTGSSTPDSQKWYFYAGLYYQGRQALNEAIAAHHDTGFGIGSYGSGKNRGYSYAGQGYGTYYDAHNARVQALTGLPGQSARELTSLAGLAAKATSTVQAAVAKIAATLDAARAARAVPSSLVTQFKKDNSELDKALAARDRWAQRVKDDRAALAQDRQALRDYGAQVTATSLGRFDIGTSGAGYAGGIASSLHQAVADQGKENRLTQKAKALGLDPRLVAQLESEGAQGDANLQAIVDQGKSYVAGINKDYAKLVSESHTAGSQAEKDNVEINKQIRDDNKRIADDSAKQLAEQRKIRDELAAIKDLTRRMNRELESATTKARKHA